MADLWNKLRLLVSRAVVKRVNSTSKLQELQLELLSEEISDEVEHFEPYGLTAKPRSGAEAIAASVGADRAHLVALVVGDRRYRITTLDDGEVALYNDTSAVVHLKADGSIAIVQNGSGQVHIGGDPASDFVALAASVESELDKLHVHASTHIHTTASGDTGTAKSPPASRGSTAATKVKAT